MTTTDDLLAELADLEPVTPTRVDPPTPVYEPAREALTVEATAPKSVPDDLDERGYKILALTDLVIQEFDRAVNALTTVKEAVEALREELAAPSAPSLVEDEALLTSEEEEALDDDYSSPVERNPQGEADAMGDISIAL